MDQESGSLHHFHLVHDVPHVPSTVHYPGAIVPQAALDVAREIRRHIRDRLDLCAMGALSFRA